MFQNIIFFIEKFCFPLGFIALLSVWIYRKNFRREAADWRIFLILSYFAVTSLWRMLLGIQSSRYMLCIVLLQIPLSAIVLYNYDFPVLRRFCASAGTILEKYRLLIARLLVIAIGLMMLADNFYVDPYRNNLISAGNAIRAAIRPGEKAVLCDTWEAGKNSRVAYYSGLPNKNSEVTDITSPELFISEAGKYSGVFTIYWVVKVPAGKFFSASDVGMATDQWQCIFSEYRNRKGRHCIQVYRMSLDPRPAV